MNTEQDPMSAEQTGLAPAATGSRLESLRDRRAKALQAAYLDLEVPRIDPPIYVRFAPVPMHRIQSANKLTEKSKDQDRIVITNAAILAGACQGVYEIVDGTEVSIDPDDRFGDWPKFDERLAGLLGVDASKAIEVVRALYITDGDIVSTADKLAEWSGYTAEQHEREVEGN